MQKKRIKTNKNFWRQKIFANIKRDSIVNGKLRHDGWIVLRFWGKDIENNLDKCIKEIEQNIQEVQLKLWTKE